MQPVTQPPIEPCPEDNGYPDDGDPYVYKAKSPSYACVPTRFLLPLCVKFQVVSSFSSRLSDKAVFLLYYVSYAIHILPRFLWCLQGLLQKGQMSPATLSLFPPRKVYKLLLY